MFMPFQRASQNLALKDESIIFLLGFSGLHEDYISHRLKSFSGWKCTKGLESVCFPFSLLALYLLSQMCSPYISFTGTDNTLLLLFIYLFLFS